MKIIINIEENAKDTEVAITCRQMTPQIERMISMFRMLDMQLTGRKGDETFLIDTTKVLYIDTVDKRTFIYTGQEVYESGLRLYELEEQLLQSDFFRANKSCIINFRHIASLKADLDRRLLVTMSNGEKLVVSRQYAEAVKQKLGVSR